MSIENDKNNYLINIRIAAKNRNWQIKIADASGFSVLTFLNFTNI
jgi:hypothetical protein